MLVVVYFFKYFVGKVSDEMDVVQIFWVYFDIVGVVNNGGVFYGEIGKGLIGVIVCILIVFVEDFLCLQQGFGGKEFFVFMSIVCYLLGSILVWYRMSVIV